MMEIQYRNNKTEKLCTDLREAKKVLHIYAEKLHALINFIENAETLKDVDSVRYFYLHELHGRDEGKYGLDIVGRSVPWRLVIIPLDENGEEWDTNDKEYIYKSTRIVLVWEVSKHYE